jgi:hypothetical protein
VLSLFDASAETLCRNEPNTTFPQGGFGRLPPRWVLGADHDAMLRGWDAAIREARSHVGARDLPPSGRKHHLRQLPQRLGLSGLPWRRGTGRLLRWLSPSVRSGQWRRSALISDRNRALEAFAVLKINATAGWAAWVLEHRPHVPVFHLVRHPAGALNSYLKRWLSRQDQAAVLADSRLRARQIRELRPDWSDRLERIDSMGVSELEMWWWRYLTESLLDVGANRPGYMRIVFEELAVDPVGLMREAYRRCGLQWTEDVEVRVAATARTSSGIARAWRSDLDAETVRAVERAVGDSPAMALWGEA